MKRDFKVSLLHVEGAIRRTRTNQILHLVSSKTCDGLSAQCAAVIVSGVASMGCCSSIGATVNCQVYGKCFNSAEVAAATVCGTSCVANTNIVKWLVSYNSAI
jgi:hypothetical protein